MSRDYKVDRYKVIFTGTIQNESPLIIGGGGDNETDIDIFKDKNGKPLIPGSSFAGVLRHHLLKHYQKFGGNGDKKLESDLLKSYFGYSEGDSGNSSKIIFSDLTLESSANIQIRDGIRIDYKTGIVVKQGKFDFEVIEPGAAFNFRIEIGGDNKNEILKLIAMLKRDVEKKRIAIGAKKNLGFGKIELKRSVINLYDLHNKSDILKWIKKESNLFKEVLTEPYAYQSDIFRIEFDFVIKDSLIVKHYSNNPLDSDSSHIKSNGQNIIPGTSVKGAIRARAERILNTLGLNYRTELFNFMFGNSSANDKENGKKYVGSISSRVKISEVVVDQNVEASIQQRIKIDRFTGGTINGALFDSMPIFSKDYNKTNRLIMELKNPIDAEIGLLLLILKDLWTGDLPIGGEKNIGRGVLKGIKAKILHKDLDIEIGSISSISDEVKEKLQKYVSALNNADFGSHLNALESRYYKEEAINE